MTRGADNRAIPLILVVDDDSAIRLMAREALEQAGFAVEEADDGSTALERFAESRPDFVIMDVVMHETDGYTACAKIREMSGGRHVPVLMITGLDDMESITRAYEAGATDFATKPINYVLLPHRVRYMLRAKETGDELRESETRLADAQRIARLGHWQWQPDRSIVNLSDGIRRIFGWPFQKHALSFENFISHVHDEDRDEVETCVTEALEGLQGFSLQHRITRADGDERIVYQEAEVVQDAEGETGLVGTVQDVTERVRAEQKIRYLAHYDRLTGLPNRVLLKDYLGKAIAHAGRHHRHVGLISIDLDHFKRINDTKGHTVGDRLLQDVAVRIAQCLRDSDVISREEPYELSAPFMWNWSTALARLGGDEFVLLLSEITRAEDAAVVARRIADTLTLPFMVDGNEVYVTASMGISVYPMDGDSDETLLKHADVALYHAKDLGRNNYQFYTASLNARAVKRFSVETDLRKALEAEQFQLDYQPKIDMHTGEVLGLEALVRWHHPDKGLISPGEFIPVAEDTGLIVPLGEWVLRRACEQTQQWHDAGLDALCVSVNISAAQLGRNGLQRAIIQSLADTALEPHFLELELTESLLMQYIDDSVTLLSELREVGVQISIDDFGTGYSSLAYLKRLPIQILKIDRSFVRDLTTDADDAAIVTATIALAHNLRLRVVAEGVEEQAQLEFLRQHGCDAAQGYLISRPLPAGEVVRWLNEWHQGSRAEAV